jgi:hypothetical protein
MKLKNFKLILIKKVNIVNKNVEKNKKQTNDE